MLAGQRVPVWALVGLVLLALASTLEGTSPLPDPFQQLITTCPTGAKHVDVESALLVESQGSGDSSPASTFDSTPLTLPLEMTTVYFPEKKKKELMPLDQWREERLAAAAAIASQASGTPQSPASLPEDPPTSEPDAIEPKPLPSPINTSETAITTSGNDNQGPGVPSKANISTEVPTALTNQTNSTTAPSLPNAASTKPSAASAEISNQTPPPPAVQPVVATVEPASPEVSHPPKDKPDPPAATVAPKKYRKDRYNYGSAECGAKVLAANSEATEVSSILFPSRDKYMLSPCSAARKWIVLELCEDVGVDQIALGNFEYFSSMFRDFQVLGSRKYPVSHWNLLGNFTARNARELQTFALPPDQPVQWFKYLKIRFFNHYGNEFYCPISEVRVHGLTIVEQISAQLEMDSEEIQHLEAVVKPKAPDTPNTPTPTPSRTDVAATEVKTKHPHPTSSIHAPDQVLIAGPISPLLNSEHLLQKFRNAAGDNSKTLDSIAIQLSKQLTASFAPEQITVDDTDGEGKIVGIEPTKAAIGGDEDGDEEDDAEEELVRSYPKNVIATANVFQFLINRFKGMEMNQSLLTGYVLNMSSYFKEELEELQTDQATLLKIHQNLAREVSVALNSTIEKLTYDMKKIVSEERKETDKRDARLDHLVERLTERLEQQDTELSRLRIIFSILCILMCLAALILAIIAIRGVATSSQSSTQPLSNVLNVTAALRARGGDCPHPPSIGSDPATEDSIVMNRADSDPIDRSERILSDDQIPINRGWKFWNGLKASFSTSAVPPGKSLPLVANGDPKVAEVEESSDQSADDSPLTHSKKLTKHKRLKSTDL